MDDRKLNPLRMLVGLAILGYLALSVWTNRENPAENPATKVNLQPQPAAIAEESSPAATSSTGCTGQITWVTGGAREVRLGITGAASRILVYTERGTIVRSTEEAGSAGEYRVILPAPPQAVQIDDCPTVNLP